MKVMEASGITDTLKCCFCSFCFLSLSCCMKKSDFKALTLLLAEHEARECFRCHEIL